MSRVRKLKGMKGRCEDDPLKPAYPVHCVQCEEHENISQNSGGSPRHQGGYRTDSTPDDRCHGNKENESDDRRVLLAITVEIEDGCVEHIEMKEGDSAEAVATKFCRDHSLPDQFVAPLTEHIVSNIISIRKSILQNAEAKKLQPINFCSKEDKDIVFCSKDECGSYEDNWPAHTTKDGCHMAPDNNDSDYENRSAKSCGCKVRPGDYPLAASQKANKYSCKGPISPKKARQKTGQRRKVSNRLVAPTITSLAKSGGLEKDKPKSCGARPVSERAKAVYMRLYAEFLRQKQKLEEDKKRSLELYQEKIERDKTGISKKSWRIMRMRGRTAKQYRNYGELLYTEGLTKRENQMKLIAKKQKDDEAREMAEITGKPEISKRAKNIRREQGQVWNRLQTQDKPRQDQLQELRNEIWEAKLMECTFKPQINHRRGGGEDFKDSSCDRFEQLFLDAESRRRRQAEYVQWYPEGVTFRPAINRRQCEGSDMDGEYHQEGSVFDRLLQYASKLTEKKQMQEHLGHRPIDPNTGRQLFKPLTGRKPQNDRNPVHLPIGEYLYKMKFTFDSKKEGIAARNNKLKEEQANCHYVGATSQKLLGRIKERGFKQVFDCLDEDKDGYVELATANLQRLSKDVVQDVAQVMKMGAAAEKALNFAKFVDLMMAVENKSHRGQHVHVVLKHKNHADDSNFTYEFKMDRLSRNLASRRRRFSTSRQWYKIICSDKERRQQRVEELRKERQNQEMAECTFRPELITRINPKSKGGRKGGGGMCESVSSIVEKVQQEVHGFYFQDERGPEWLGLPASGPANAVSRTANSNAVVVDDHADEVGPLGLLESLKLMVAESLESPAPGGSSFDYMTAQRIDDSAQGNIAALDDLPEADGPKQGLFFGILGA